MMKRIFKTLASVQLTVWLLVLSMVLVFFGTLDQVHYGVFETQQRYFGSFFVGWEYPKQWVGGDALSWFVLPMPGGVLLGGLLLLNLVAAHFRYFVPKLRKLGIHILHGGLVLLIVSGFLTSWVQEESQMAIEEGKSANYAENFSENELVIIDKTDAKWDEVYALPIGMVKSGNVVGVEGTPFEVKVEKYYVNAQLGMAGQMENPPENLANMGAGVKMGLVVFPQKATYKEGETNAATAYVTVRAGGEELGTWLVSSIIDGRFPSQKFAYGGREYELWLRFKRTYFPFDMKLEAFTHEKYPGTEIPKDFSSQVSLVDSESGESRRVKIYMNHPLRTAGYTFYQASFGQGDTVSVLQVVKNPSRVLPYVAVAVVGLGLLVQFGLSLWRFLKKER